VLFMASVVRRHARFYHCIDLLGPIADQLRLCMRLEPLLPYLLVFLFENF
jgi:hypothetical protein